jgi:hypothetical protein
VGVLVLNASMEPLHTVSVPHAVRMLVRKVAEIHEADVDTTFGHYPLPRVGLPAPSTTSRRCPGVARARAG